MLKLSVLMPAYNEGKTLEKIVEKVIKQKVEGVYDLEIIIVDDRSKDNTRAIIESLKNKYKNTIETKYSKTLLKMNNAELTNLVSKIDLLSKEIQTKNYTTSTKQNYNAILSVLRDLAFEKISE